jgi:hypothetical protein
MTTFTSRVGRLLPGRERALRRTVLRTALGAALALGGAAPIGATTLIRQDTRALVRTSSDIVVGRVASVRSHWDDSHRHIVTDVEIEVSQSLKGAEGRLTLTQLGGEVDGARLFVPGCPTFKRGEEALLFVWRDARGRAQLNGLGQGKFEIRRDPLTQERSVARLLPGLEFGDTRSLRPPRSGEAPQPVSLQLMLNEIRRVMAEGDR